MNPYIALPILFFSVVVHECAHGLAAYRAGDSTAYQAGRITLNPLPHIDLFGSIIVPVILLASHASFFIAWAKPVPVNPSLFRNPRVDDIKVSFAGPLSNILLALVFVLIGIVFRFPIPVNGGDISFQVGGVGEQLCLYGITLNLLLAFFNLIPVFPLDGSHILANLLPPDLEYRYRSLNQFGFIILLILITTPVIGILLTPAWISLSFLIRIWSSFN